MCGYFCIAFIDFMLAGTKFTDYTSLFSLHDFKKNDNLILPSIEVILSKQLTKQFYLNKQNFD